MLTEEDLELPAWLEPAVNRAAEMTADDDEPELDFFAEVDDRIMDLITAGWRKGGGAELNIPAYVTFHDADFYFDLAQQKAFSEKDIKHLIR